MWCGVACVMCKGDAECVQKRLFTAVEPKQTAGRELFKNKEGWESLVARIRQDEQRMLSGLKEDR